MTTIISATVAGLRGPGVDPATVDAIGQRLNSGDVKNIFDYVGTPALGSTASRLLLTSSKQMTNIPSGFMITFLPVLDCPGPTDIEVNGLGPFHLGGQQGGNTARGEYEAFQFVTAVADGSGNFYITGLGPVFNKGGRTFACANAGGTPSAPAISTDQLPTPLQFGDLRAGDRVGYVAQSANLGPMNVVLNGLEIVVRKQAGALLEAGEIPQFAIVDLVWLDNNNSLFLPTPATPQIEDGGLAVPVDDPVFSQTDYPAASTVTRSAGRLTIVRPIVDELNYRTAVPGARDRCQVRGTWIEYTLRLGDAAQGGAREIFVLVDGEPATGITKTPLSGGGTAIQRVRVNLDPSASHTVELMFPYGCSMAIVGRHCSTDAVFTEAGPAARPASSLVVSTDSLIQGFTAETGVEDTCSVKLAGKRGRRLINHGYGGRKCVPADGAIVGAENGTESLLLVGANDVSAGTPLATFEANLRAWIAGFMGAHSEGAAAKLLVASQPWMLGGDGATSVPIPGSQYRARTQAVVADLVGTYPNVHYVDGLTLSEHTTWDGTHWPSIEQDRAATRLDTAMTGYGW